VFTLQVDLRKLKQGHRNFLSTHDFAVNPILSAEFQTAEVQKNIEANPVPIKRTRHLKKMSVAHTIRTKNGTIVRVQNAAKYAWAQDQGSGLHGPRASKYRITPKNPGGLLRFFWRKKGRWVTLRFVNHPGVPATHFLEVATTTSFHRTGLLLREAMRKAAKRF